MAYVVTKLTTVRLGDGRSVVLQPGPRDAEQSARIDRLIPTKKREALEDDGVLVQQP